MSTKKRKRTSLISATNALPLPVFAAAHFPSSSSTFTTTNETYALTLSAGPGSRPPPTTTTTEQQQPHTLSAADLAACFALVAATSRADYEASARGWRPRHKRAEMRDGDMRFVVARRAGGEAEVVGFCSFMFTHEDGVAVVYVYEIHLVAEARGCGLGKRMLGLVEGMGRGVGVEKVMLTVFRRNEKAVGWYARMGYGVDEYSPEDKVLRGGKVKKCDYLILSKELRPRERGEGNMGEEG